MKLLLKIIGWAMFGYLAIALVLYFSGVTHVDFDDRYYSFMIDVNLKLGQWANIQIPKIPSVSYGKVMISEGFYIDFTVGSSILNAFIDFFNLIIGILNTIWTVLKFIVAMLVVLFEDLPQILSNSGSSSSSSTSNLSAIFPYI